MVFLLAGCGDAAICTSEEFRAALESDSAMEVGACRIEGDFTISRALSVHGSGTELRGNLTIESEGRVELSGLAISSPSRAAILARGGSLVLTDVDITTELGVGIALENVQAELTNVSVRGSVDPNNPPALPVNFGIGDASTHGVAAFGGTVALDGVEISGTAAAGALFSGSSVEWTGGRVFDSLAIGILGEGGSVSVGGAEIDGIVQGFDIAPAYGVVFFGAGSYSTSAVHVTATQGIGVAQIGSSAVHADLEADANSVAGVWVEHGDVELTGNLHDNLFSSFVAVEASNIDVHDATIDRTAKRTRQVEITGRIEVGDGIQIVSPTGETSINAVTMSGNERAGLLLDLPAQFGTIAISDLEITVTSSGAAAAVAQGPAPSDWDQGVTRNGTDAAADRAVGPLDVLGVIAPCDHPKQTGLSALIDIGL